MVRSSCHYIAFVWSKLYTKPKVHVEEYRETYNYIILCVHPIPLVQLCAEHPCLKSPPPFPPPPPEPEHVRGQSNLRFFNDIRDSQPEEFVDGEEEGEGGKELTEHERYEQTCREGTPIVSHPNAFLV